jgi:hypothetical protein
MLQKRPTKNSSNTDPFVQQFFARIPPKTAATFTDTQLAALKQVFKERMSKNHAVDIKLSIPFLKRGFYVVLLLGKDKRLRPTKTNFVLKNSRLTISILMLITLLIGSFYVLQRGSQTNSFPEQDFQIKEYKGLSNM